MNERAPRFLGGHMDEKSLIQPDAQLRHVDAEGRTRSRDRFGNRIFSSNGLAYPDREGEITKSALLVSEAGEQWLKENPGILKAIDFGLKQLSPKIEGRELIVTKERLELGHGWSLQYLAEGAQSVVYKLETPGQTYVLKIHLTYSYVHQPYINEMLQTQFLQQNLEGALQKLEVDLPSFMFASGQVACVEYIPREADLPPDFESTYYALATTAEDCTAQQKKDKNELWKNISIDKVHRNGFPTGNFRRRENGRVVWIDPVAYFSDDGPKKPDIYLNDKEAMDLKPLTELEMKESYALAAAEVRNFYNTVMNFDASDDARWLAYAQGEIKKILPDASPDSDDFGVDFHRTMKQILKNHNVRWMLNPKK